VASDNPPQRQQQGPGSASDNTQPPVEHRRRGRTPGPVAAQLLPGIALRVVQLLPPAQLLEQVVATAIFGHDQTYLERPCVRRRAIEVDTSAVGIVEFDAPKEKRQAVVANGEKAAERFLNAWDWERFKKECRAVPDES